MSKGANILIFFFMAPGARPPMDRALGASPLKRPIDHHRLTLARTQMRTMRRQDRVGGEAGPTVSKWKDVGEL